MKVIIAGGRDFDNYAQLKSVCADILLGMIAVNDIEIVSGCAPGADSLGEKFADSIGLPVKRFPADWAKYGKSAGPIRNQEMAHYANVLIAFWNGKSRGTEGMIKIARSLNLIVHVVKY